MRKTSRDLDHVRYIKSDNRKVLIKDNDIKESWKEYFNILLDEGGVRNERG